MRAEGKTPKVLIAAATQEPVINFPEGEMGRTLRGTNPLRAEPDEPTEGKAASYFRRVMAMAITSQHPLNKKEERDRR